MPRSDIAVREAMRIDNSATTRGPKLEVMLRMMCREREFLVKL